MSKAPDIDLAIRVAHAVQDCHGYGKPPLPFSDPKYHKDLDSYWQQVATRAVELLRDQPELLALAPAQLQDLIDTERDKLRAEQRERWGWADPGAAFDEEVRNSKYLQGKPSTSAATKAANTAALLAGLSLTFSNEDQS